ncbi:acyl-CoA dehydrogenase family protein [Sandaracinobacter sp. RS1-74]|uniref:acyl-CoA dehydrogenase family protein n=1 Tax=Sandaracinobacteroides sayramensis TaxID=2913411 RepID=UPI001EDAB46D|nr:acyl-CoA dehydrogenase family protein [Sandaracinobacteroides sayramensis]MCG2841101.1 acyl-CoA dehydrogenase family protein [Sandaracinobacteroides sayramensis]
MATAAAQVQDDQLILPGLPARLAEAASAAQAWSAAVRSELRARLSTADGRIDRNRADAEQHLVHGFGWVASYAELLREVADWVRELETAGRLTEIEALLAQLLFAEYAAQLRGGIPMNQGETIRPHQLSDDPVALAHLQSSALGELIRLGGMQAVKTAIARHLADAQGRATLEDSGLDETLTLVREQFFAFSNEKVRPHAHQWHLADELIPIDLVDELSEMGVFGMTIPEAFGGLGMGKTAMCVVSEELSRGWIGVGSLATRSEIAAELILGGGTPEQKRQWIPEIASGAILPTAVFTEPDTGSDLGALRTRATRDGARYLVSGNKTWITHAARADVMTLLVRTNPDTTDHRGLSMLIAPKPRGTVDTPFPAEGMTGGEIEVIGYRGMKEYEIGFDSFAVPAANLLGGVEGQGFKQLMATFESARIQTAARAVGVAQAALDVGLSYALDRRQFARPIFEFPRVANKLAMMAAEIMGARQLTYFAARRKDEDKRCDLEAGMAKLVAARVAWAAADNALQIHGGNGFATEYPVSRLLADARILNIFEGAGEIQAQVIARRLLDEGN